jgi:hypothetical protein
VKWCKSSYRLLRCADRCQRRIDVLDLSKRHPPTMVKARSPLWQLIDMASWAPIARSSIRWLSKWTTSTSRTSRKHLQLACECELEAADVWSFRVRFVCDDGAVSRWTVSITSYY